ncbi:hypothetical protein [Micromonospora sp. NPDC047074]|uniref:hypothetical protein n=1 Tax=Micromonospora sp. NPDC047074 TaxID=3154339 RepID=UPI0033E6A756
MAFRTWGRLVLTALGVSLLAGAGQLGVAFGFGIVRLTGAFTGATINQWPAQLVWVGWFAANAAVVGAVLTERLARRDGGLAGTGRLLAVAAAAALGATVVAPLCMQPARAADLVSADPVWAVGICAVLGALAGAGAALAILFQPPVGWNMAAFAGAIWLLAVVSVAPSLASTGPLSSVRLGVLEPAWLDDVAAQRLALPVLPLLALLAGAATGGLARWRGHPPLVSGATGVAGPVLVAFAYLAAGPGDATDRYQLMPYYAALLAVAAGTLGSAAATLLRWPLLARTAPTEAIEPTDILRPLPTGPALPPAPAPAGNGDESPPQPPAGTALAAADRSGSTGVGGTTTASTADVPPPRAVPPHWDWPGTGGTGPAPAADTRPVADTQKTVEPGTPAEKSTAKAREATVEDASVEDATVEDAATKGTATRGVRAKKATTKEATAGDATAGKVRTRETTTKDATAEGTTTEEATTVGGPTAEDTTVEGTTAPGQQAAPTTPKPRRTRKPRSTRQPTSTVPPEEAAPVPAPADSSSAEPTAPSAAQVTSALPTTSGSAQVTSAEPTAPGSAGMTSAVEDAPAGAPAAPSPTGPAAAPSPTGPAAADDATPARTEPGTPQVQPDDAAEAASSATDPAPAPAPRPRHRAPMPDLARAASWEALATARRAGPVPAPTDTPQRPGTAAPETAATPPDGTATPAGAEQHAGRVRGRLGLFRRNRPQAGDGPAEREAESLPEQDEEYVDWVTGLSRPVPDNEPEQENGRRSLRSTGRHHRD